MSAESPVRLTLCVDVAVEVACVPYPVVNPNCTVELADSLVVHVIVADVDVVLDATALIDGGVVSAGIPISAMAAPRVAACIYASEKYVSQILICFMCPQMTRDPSWTCASASTIGLTISITPSKLQLKGTAPEAVLPRKPAVALHLVAIFV